MTLIPLLNRGIRYARKSLDIRTSLGDVWGRGQSLYFYSVVLYVQARYREAVEKAREALRLLQRTGDSWEVHLSQHQVAACSIAWEICVVPSKKPVPSISRAGSWATNRLRQQALACGLADERSFTS